MKTELSQVKAYLKAKETEVMQFAQKISDLKAELEKKPAQQEMGPEILKKMKDLEDENETLML